MIGDWGIGAGKLSDNQHSRYSTIKNKTMNSTELKNRTKKFAHDCVKITSELPNTQLGRHIAGQLNRSSTSVAANYRATCHAQSKYCC